MAGKMTLEQIEAEIQDVYARLAGAAATVRYYHEHYMDGLPFAAAEQARRMAGDFARLRSGAGHAYHAQVSAVTADFDRAVTDVGGVVTALTAAHPWELSGFGDPVWDRYRPDQEARHLDGLRVGLLRTGTDNGLPPLPAVARLAGHGHLLISAEPGAADAARSLLQAVTLRLVVAARPGAVRLALADAAGQGRQLSTFLRLPASLRAGDLAVSDAEVEALLLMLTGHVSEVNKTRLTNVYDSLEEYNATVPGMAIAYHVLVVDGFPSGFSDRAAELLVRLARNGPRAGVYLVATVDQGVAMPRDFDLADLTSVSTNLTLTRPGHATWDDQEFGLVEIEPDQMPAADHANAWLDAVASASSSVSQDLPFAQIAAPAARRWQGDASTGLNVPIGVDGKGEPVRFALGTGGAQHGLLGGTTQMGKSNLLHVLIHQLALCYPPEELELYLLDFKEVEFSVYLTQHLPHARVIASRTDREFGLSVLHRFRDEIDRRSRLFREAGGGITAIADYRAETGQALSRALLVMDEYQVLFEADGQFTTADRIAQEAGRLLADVARRGAAFGLHLLLCTQSPGDSLNDYLKEAYKQLTLRVAMACHGPDSRVSETILGDDSATRLTRPGDAIYQDPAAPGASPQIRVARLGGRERLEWISAIRGLGAGREYPPPVSFDPDMEADFAANPACAAFSARPGRWPEPGPVIEAWLGEAIEIKPATASAFWRGMKRNLLITGTGELAHAMLMATVLSAAVQLPPAGALFTIIDLTPPSSPMRGVFQALVGLPHGVRIAGPRTADAELRALVTDLDERLAGPEEQGAPERFLIIADLRRWPDLLPDDEYGETTSAQDLLVRLARDGPDAGIHVVAWADSYATAEHLFQSRGLRRWFALRVALHLDPVESDSLLGVPDAAMLGAERALYRDTDWHDGKVEKFKPYSVASLLAFAATAFPEPS